MILGQHYVTFTAKKIVFHHVLFIILRNILCLPGRCCGAPTGNNLNGFVSMAWVILIKTTVGSRGMDVTAVVKVNKLKRNDVLFLHGQVYVVDSVDCYTHSCIVTTKDIFLEKNLLPFEIDDEVLAARKGLIL
jgi:hypothetical protein